MALSLNPTTYDFGTIANGSSNPFVSVQVTNTSAVSTTVSVVNSLNFYYSGVDRVISANSTVTFRIYALTSNNGAHTEEVDFEELSGGIATILLSSNIITANPGISVTPASHDFNIVYLNDAKPSINIDITNTGNIELILTYNDTAEFKFTSTAPPARYPLQPGATITANIEALTNTEGVFSESPSVTTDWAVSDSILLDIDVRIKTYTYASSPSFYNFGTLDLNDTNPYFDITINNTGNQEITVTMASSDPAFYTLVGSVTLQSVSFTTVRAYARTNTVGTFSGNIVLTETVTNVVTNITVDSIIVDDVRTFTVDKHVIDFGNVDLNQVIPTDTFTITNTSPSATLDFLIIDNYEFTVTPLSFTLATGAAQVLTVTASTASIGYFDLYIYIRENGAIKDGVNLKIRVNDPNNLIPVKNGLVVQYEETINSSSSYLTAPVGTDVNKWVDISGNNNDADVGSSLYPTVTDVPFRGIRTGRASGVLSVFDNVFIDTLTGERTVFYVGTRERIGLRSHIFTTVGGDRGVIYSRSSDNLMFEYADSGLVVDYLAPSQSIDEITMPMYKMRASDGAVVGHIDGAETIDSTTADDGMMSIDQIGGGRIGTSDYEFIMSAFIVYDRFLTDQEVIDVEDYLSNKYSIPLHRLIDAPTNLVATLNLPNIEVTWVNPAVPFTTSHLERRINSNPVYTEIYSGSAISSYVDSDVELDHIYTYRVRVKNTELGEVTYSAYSNFNGAAVIPNAPDPISNLEVFENYYHHILLSWDNPDYSVNAITHIEIERRLTGDPTYSNINTIIAGATGYDDASFLPGETYDYRVRNAWLGFFGSVYSSWVEILNIKTDPADNAVDDGCFSVPGIVEVYIAEFTDNVNYTYRTLNAVEVTRVSAEIMEYIGIDKWFSLHVNNNADFTQTMSRTDRGAVFTDTLSLAFSKADQSKYMKLMGLINSNYVVVFKDRNGKLWTFGYAGGGASITVYERETSENEFVIKFSESVSDKIITRLSDFYYKRYIL